MTRAIALFNNKGGVGKTTLTYHLSHMVARLGWRVLAVDLDPQANLTSAFFDEDELELLWEPESQDTILSAVAPLIRQLGDVEIPQPREAAERLWVVPGDLGLSSFEDRLSDAWPRSFLGDEGSIRVTTAFHRIIRGCATQVNADVVFLDVGPNLGAINRAALLASDDLVVPLAADLFSLQGLRNLGPTLRDWRRAWQDLGLPNVPATIEAPGGEMRPIGYVVLQHAVRLDRPVKAYDRWLRRIPTDFHRSVLGECEPMSRARRTDSSSPACATTAASCRSPKTPASRCSIFGPATARSVRPVGSCRPVTGSSRISPAGS
jgi:chromosome partitioning protein